MNKVHIDEATNTQLDYAAAVGQEMYNPEERQLDYIFTDKKTGKKILFCNGEVYHPTTDQTQCGELIDKFKICCIYLGMMSGWEARLYSEMTNLKEINSGTGVFAQHESRLIAAVKAFLWSIYPGGMIPAI